MTSHRRDSLLFGPLTIAYDDRVLAPRPWTALQSEWAAELLDDGPEGAVLELCSGAGHIGLLAAVLSGRALVAVDLNPAACAYARDNAADGGLGERVEVREGRLEEVLAPDDVFAVVVADPPWVTTDRIGDYPEDPELAIDGGTDGLAVARACLEACVGHVAPGGSVLLQLGDDDQADRLLAESTGDDAPWRAGGRRAGAGGVVQQLLPVDGGV